MRPHMDPDTAAAIDMDRAEREALRRVVAGLYWRAGEMIEDEHDAWRRAGRGSDLSAEFEAWCFAGKGDALMAMARDMEAVLASWWPLP